MPEPSEHNVKPWPTALLLLGVVLLGLGARWWLIGHIATGVPYWDEWDGDGIRILAPYEWGKLQWQSFLDLHNEHRPALTRMTDFLLYLANNHMWDTRVTMTCNALIIVGTYGGLLWTCRRLARPGHFAGICALAALLLSLPYAWENTLIGFQSSFYFLLATNCLHLGLSLGRTCRQPGWWLGQLIGALGLYTIASGFMSGLVLALVSLWRIRQDRRVSARHLANLVAGLILTGLGVLLMHTMPHHAGQRASGLLNFLRATGVQLSWPCPPGWAAWLLVPMPGVLFLIWLHRRQTVSTPSDWLIASGLLWHFCQVALLALFRAPGVQALHAHRYFDLHALGLLFTALACGRMLQTGSRRGAYLAGATVWLLLVGVSLGWVSWQAWQERVLPFREDLRRQEARLALYCRTGDPRLILDAPEAELPYPGRPDWLLHLLSQPALLHALPPSVRPPLPIGDRTLRGFNSAGVPASAGNLAGLKARGNAGVGAGDSEWRTVPLYPTFPFFRLRTAAEDPGAVRFGWRYLADQVDQVSPQEAIGARHWKSINIPTRGQAIEIYATSPGSAQWLCFSELVEVGRLSWFDSKLLAAAPALAALGLLLFAGGGIANLRRV